MPLTDIAAWFTQHPDLGEILDRKGEGRVAPIFISEHPDQLLGAERGYGKAKKPDDYLKEFTAFINSHRNDIQALLTVLTRPRELTRKQLRELALELDRAGYSEVNLAIAWREKTNQDIAARIIGYIRQAAIGDPLLPYEQRVDNALQKMLASRSGPCRSVSGYRRSLPRPKQTSLSIALRSMTRTSSSSVKVVASPGSTVSSVANSRKYSKHSTMLCGKIQQHECRLV